MYDLVAGSKTVKSSYYLSKRNALELFPMLKGDKLTGAIVYYDGKFFKKMYILSTVTSLIIMIRNNYIISIIILHLFFISMLQVSKTMQE